MLRFAFTTAAGRREDVPRPIWTAPVSDFPSFDYDMKDVRRAGQALAGNLVWTDETAESIREFFRIANNWRDSHAFPMRRLRSALYGQMRKQKVEGNTVARLKRMPSIRRKLRNQQWPLDAIQDLAGCRAILPSIKDVNSLIEAMRKNSNQHLHRENSYIASPKPDGYRCHHMVFKFQGVGDEAVFNDRRIEIQIRTRLQHSWATAVETVGLFRRENMKAGEGDPHWLRLFLLMSAEFAVAEKCPEPLNVPKRTARVKEIIELDKRLQATDALENMSHAVRYSDTFYVDPESRPEYYLIVYDRANKVVNVRPSDGAILGVKTYDETELDAEKAKNGVTAVLVEADGIEALKAAYPNYFGDVQLFKMQLKNVTQGEQPVEYTMPPQETVPKGPKEKVDLSWFKRRMRWK